MKRSTLALFLAAVALSPALRAQTPMSPRSGSTPTDLLAEYAWAGRSAIAEGTRPLGRIGGSHWRGHAIVALPTDANTVFLVGVGGQELQFNPDAGSPIPDRLSSAAFKLGVNYRFDQQWSLRTEVDAGRYGDMWNAPFAVRAIYATSADLQWAMGLNVDFRSAHPVVGGVGVRWKFAPDWTLQLLIPAPRVEWAVAPDITLFAGASLRGGTFRLADDFGRTHGRPTLDRQIVDYREINVGIGARWQCTPACAVNLGVGQLLDRRFQFHDRNLLFNGDGAPAAQLTVTGVF